MIGMLVLGWLGPIGLAVLSLHSRNQWQQRALDAERDRALARLRAARMQDRATTFEDMAQELFDVAMDQSDRMAALEDVVLEEQAKRHVGGRMVAVKVGRLAKAADDASARTVRAACRHADTLRDVRRYLDALDSMGGAARAGDFAALRVASKAYDAAEAALRKAVGR